MEVYNLKIKKKEFRNLSNKERAEKYADIKSHDEIYLASDYSVRKKIHDKRFNILHQLMGDVSNKKILDAGAGEGYFLSSIQSNQKFGIELSEIRVKTALKLFPKLTIGVSDVRKMPFDDNSFDIIVCSEVLEHVDGFLNAIEEFKRCIKPDGIIILSFPNENTVALGRLFLLKFPIHEIDHINSIKPSDIEKSLGKNYEVSNIPKLPYPWCLYQVYKFSAKNFKNSR